ncbi:MAG: hypothetical protein ACRD1K_09400 [Acidimicrobiales bacterium]
MADFDPDRYRKSVLAPVRAKGGIEASDPFELFDLDPTEDDDATISDRTAEVVAFWHKERNNPKYKTLVTALLARHQDVLDELRDPGRRRRLRSQVVALRAERDRARFSVLDAAVSRLIERHGGLPPAKLAGLQELGRHSGLSDDECQDRMAPHPVAGTGPAAEELSPAVRAQIRSALDELGQLTGNPAPPSLFDLLGVGIDAPESEIRQRHGELAARNRERRADRLRALIDELLTEAMHHLVRNDRELYVQAMAADVAARLRPQVLLAVLVEDEVGDQDRRHLVGQAIELGLDAPRARQLVDHLAWEAGDRRWCASGGGVPDVDDDDPVGGVRPTASPGDRRILKRAISDARSALDAGRPAAAAAYAAVADSLGEGPAVSSVVADSARALDGARRSWAQAEEAIGDRRFVAAQALLTGLARTAEDVVGPPSAGGRLPAARLAFVSARVSAALKLLASADHRQGAPGSGEIEILVLEVLDLCADLPAALEALARIPPSPPTKVSVERDGGAVMVRWEPSVSAGVVDYKVTREAGGASRTVGTTTRCSLEDGGAAPREQAAYTVTARRGGASSAPVSVR